VTSRAAKAASPAPSASIDSEIPMATPCWGFQPPIQYANGCGAACIASSTHRAVTAIALSAAAVSLNQRGAKWPTATSSGPARKGTTTGNEESCDTSVTQRPQVGRVNAAEALVRLHDEG
jgi:hypothetical protein